MRLNSLKSRWRVVVFVAALAPALVLDPAALVGSGEQQVAAAGPRVTFPDRVRRLRRQMQRRGDPAGEISLALAALYAKARRGRQVMQLIAMARKQGIAAVRTDLLLGSFYRRVGRYDAAFSTLVRVLVRHEEQPYALVELWKTLYDFKLRGGKASTDTESIRQRLAESGLHFPRRFKVTSRSVVRAKKLTASGYNTLLQDRPRIAAALFTEAIDLNPSYALAHRGLGIARARAQDYLRAAGAYLVYLELSPDASDAAGVDRALMEYWKSRYPAVGH